MARSEKSEPSNNNGQRLDGSAPTTANTNTTTTTTAVDIMDISADETDTTKNVKHDRTNAKADREDPNSNNADRSRIKQYLDDAPPEEGGDRRRPHLWPGVD